MEESDENDEKTATVVFNAGFGGCRRLFGEDGSTVGVGVCHAHGDPESVLKALNRTDDPVAFHAFALETASALAADLDAFAQVLHVAEAAGEDAMNNTEDSALQSVSRLRAEFYRDLLLLRSVAAMERCPAEIVAFATEHAEHHGGDK